MTTTAARADVAQQLFSFMHTIRRATLERFSDEGLSFARAKVLWQLAEAGPMRASALAGQLDCAAATATELVDALVQDGFAFREPDPKDRRAVLVSLTGSGQDLAASTLEQKHQILEEIFSCLDDTQVGQLSALLGQLADSAATPSTTPGAIA